MRDVTVIMPMAGNGRRFQDSGYDLPKPFIDVNGKPMVERALESFPEQWNVIPLMKWEHVSHSYLVERLQSQRVLIPRETAGPVETIMYADGRVASDSAVIIADCDQIVDTSVVQALAMAGNEFSGALVTFHEPEGLGHYSYVKGQPLVEETAEKKVISEWASAGLYYFWSWEAFKSAAYRMMGAQDKTRGEYYVCPTYNYLPGLVLNLMVDRNHFISLGTPEDLHSYLEAQSGSS